MNLDGKRVFDQLARDNLEPNAAYHERQSHLYRDPAVDLCGRKLCHQPGPDIAIKEQAARELWWAGVAATISRAKNLILHDTISGKLSCEQRDLLQEAAEALTPAIQKAMARKREHSDEYTKLFDERARA